MAHIIETIRNREITDAISELRIAHSTIVSQIAMAQTVIETDQSSWGVRMKRLEVDLPKDKGLIGKKKEKVVELINILATAERTISALEWFSRTFPASIVRECHASTSDDSEGNDIVLIDKNKSIVARCEVCDVASSNPGQNGKEKKDIKKLGCSINVPSDGVHRFIATSEEFAKALSSSKRKWANMNYRYKLHQADIKDETIILEILPPETEQDNQTQWPTVTAY